MLMRVMCAALLTCSLLATPAWADKAEYTEAILQNAAVALGDGSTLPVDRYTSVSVEVEIVDTATISFEGSVKGATWRAIGCTEMGSASSELVASATATSILQCNVSGLKAFRARVSAWTAGAVTVFARATTATISDSNRSGSGVHFLDLISGEDQGTGGDTSSMRVVGGAVRTKTIFSGVTTNQTTATTSIFSGGKTPIGEVSGTGPVTATITLFGTNSTVAANGVLLCTITLSDTTRHVKGCDSGAQFTQDFSHYYATTANVTGTGATVRLDVFQGIAGGASGGGAGDASAANQSTMITALQLIDNIVSGSGANISQINGVTPLMGAGATGTGSPRTTEANDSQLSAGVGATGDAAATAGGTGSLTAKLRLLTNLANDPCAVTAKTHIPINISTATTTELTPSLSGASTSWYVCAIDLITAAANNVALVDDNTDGCGSVTAGLAGGTTAASGWNFAANGGLVKGNGGNTVFKSVTQNSVLCLVTSAATQLSGSIQVVAAP